jgi:hypothetical protein
VCSLVVWALRGRTKCKLAQGCASPSAGNKVQDVQGLGLPFLLSSWVGMKTDRIRTDITDIVFVFIFMSGFGFEYG